MSKHCEFCKDIKVDHNDWQRKPFQINEYKKGETYYTFPLRKGEHKCEQRTFTLKHEAGDEYYSDQMVIHYCPICGRKLEVKMDDEPKLSQRIRELLIAWLRINNEDYEMHEVACYFHPEEYGLRFVDADGRMLEIQGEFVFTEVSNMKFGKFYDVEELGISHSDFYPGEDDE